MKIAVLGTGDIGSQLARAIAKAGHSLILANSRGPESIKELAGELQAVAATVEDAVKQAEVIVLSIPFVAIPTLADTLRQASADTTIVDMSNYYAIATGEVEEIEAGTPQTAWIEKQLGRPVIKAWNTIFSLSLATKGRPAGDPDRVALPVAGDDEAGKTIVMGLVEDTGFDAVDAGTLAESWRMQPGSPANCTDLDAAALRAALARADRARMSHDYVAQIQAVYTPEAGINMVDGVRIYREITA